ncbi:MAG: hypothetical protein ABL974_01555, partial [Prosthecobacter sp.]
MKSSDQIKDAAKRNDGSATPTEGRAAPQDIAGTKDKSGAKSKAAGNPGSGNGQRTGNGSREALAAAAVAASVPMTRSQRRASAVYASTAAAMAAASAPPVRYGDGTRFDQGARYFVDPVTPTAGTAKVKLLLSSRNDPELAAFSESIDQAMTGNPWFETPTPSDLVFHAKMAEFEGLLTQQEIQRVEAKNLTAQKDRVRKELE